MNVNTEKEQKMFVGTEQTPFDKRALADTMGQSRTVDRRSAKPAGKEATT